MADVRTHGILGVLGLDDMLEPAVEKFREIPLELIREDGENPRESFDPETMDELASTIRLRGVLTPISVRPDPEREGGFIVNHGHRRLRASKIVGKETIPAIIDEGFSDEDRLIENIQRDNLGMREVAHYIERKLKEGMKQKDIAALIGKSTAYVSNHAQLLELPPLTAGAMEQGIVNDVTTINDLIKIEKKDPAALGRFLDGREEITRSAVKAFRTELETPKPAKKTRLDSIGIHNLIDAEGKMARAPVKESVPASAKVRNTEPVFDETWRLGKVIVEQDGKRGMLRLDYRPQNEDHVWVEWEDDEVAQSEEPVASLKIKAVVQG